MGSQLKRTSELHEIEAALKRAAYKAMHGTRKERSGRFLPESRRDPKGAIVLGRIRDTKVGGRDNWRKP